MDNQITVDITAINMGNEGGSFSSTYHVGSKQELADAIANFEGNCPFSRCDREAYAEHENGDELTEEERGWFEELELSL